MHFKLYMRNKTKIIVKVIAAEKSIAEALLEVCEQTNKQFKKKSNTLEPMPNNLLKKRLSAYTSDGLLYAETCKRMYIRESDSLVEPIPPPPELSKLAKSLVNESSSSIDILRAESVLLKRIIRNKIKSMHYISLLVTHFNALIVISA